MRTAKNYHREGGGSHSTIVKSYEFVDFEKWRGTNFSKSQNSRFNRVEQNPRGILPPPKKRKDKKL